MIRRSRCWRLGRYVLTGTIRQLGSRLRLLLTLTDTEAGEVVWSDRLWSPFDTLVQGFDDLVSKIARSDQVNPRKIKELVGSTTAREQSEQILEVRERARLAHNLIIKRSLTDVRRNAR